MNTLRRSTLAIISLTLLLSAGCKKQQPIAVTPKTDVVPQQFLGTWPALSNTAQAILGDITLGSTTMRLGDHVVIVDTAHALSAEETAALASFNMVQGAPIAAFLAKVPIAAATPMLNNNTLCGNRDTQWLVGVLGSGSQLGLIVFSGAQQPVLTADALKNSHDVCGTFSFEK